MSEAQGLIRENVPLAPFTTIKVGGAADVLATCTSFAAVTTALRVAADRDLPVAVIGRGSNLIVDDAGFRGLVIRLTGRLSSISVWGERTLWCGGGASLPRAVQRAAAAGLTGLEFGASIPGTAGGAVAMNAGAYSSDLSHVLDWAVVCDADGCRRVGRDDLAMGYRTTSVTGNQVVAALGFRLAPGDPVVIRETLDGYRSHRRMTQPQGVRTFGSVFTNPPGESSGRLIEATGLKGHAIGGARVSPVHANFIEAVAGCTAADVVAVMDECRARVRAAGGPVLNPEVRYLHAGWGIGTPPLAEVV
ncbi:MAG: UDP-N-acetylmuramate dehydrogenase [Thermoleophilia bacterium]|nr:UDP-N-acetylmuramate dehydrogenase [Thermoleophilia bacterium]